MVQISEYIVHCSLLQNYSLYFSGTTFNDYKSILNVTVLSFVLLQTKICSLTLLKKPWPKSVEIIAQVSES